MVPRRTCAPGLSVLCVVLWCSSAWAISGSNPNLDGGFFIPLTGSGLLGAPPDGFGHTPDMLTLEEGLTAHGEISFFIKFTLSEEDLTPNNLIMIDTANLTLTLTDLDFLTDTDLAIHLTESLQITLLADGPDDPANPGSFVPPANSPSLTVETANYLNF